jgi:hypothetical protein
MFELDVEPQSWMSYVQMGLSLDLRPSNQYILVSESPRCLRLEKNVCAR